MRKIKEMLPFIVANTIIYFIFLSLLLYINNFILSLLILFVAIPLCCLTISIGYGVNNSLNIFYVVLTTIIFTSSILTINELMWMFGIGYGIVALIGNAIGMKFNRRNIRINSIDKVGRYLINLVIGGYIVGVLASAAMMTQMNQITYNSTAYGVTVNSLSIDLTSNTATRSRCNYNGQLTDLKEKQISSLKKMQIKAVCVISLMPIWKKNYCNPWVSDGDQYNIIRSYERSESVIYGSNAYPLTYGLVYRIIQGVIE